MSVVVGVVVSVPVVSGHTGNYHQSSHVSGSVKFSFLLFNLPTRFGVLIAFLVCYSSKVRWHMLLQELTVCSSSYVADLGSRARFV